VGFILSAVSVVILIIIKFTYGDDYFEEDTSISVKKWIYRAMWAALVCGLLIVFVPSKKDMALIYGVGGTIEYLKENDRAKELPDKVIDALSMWMDSLTEEKDNLTNK
jgi:hypothetical protein